MTTHEPDIGIYEVEWDDYEPAPKPVVSHVAVLTDDLTDFPVRLSSTRKLIVRIAILAAALVAVEVVALIIVQTLP
ncbi:hypothetical protein [Salinibacterium sp.]|uniref:hypothetical protein n=1 Tax=Salinibacterium sp. TaxID=1915057 RepID=UPI00286BF12F|nr:hypothetical protein [Salinibacterium sp.]